MNKGLFAGFRWKVLVVGLVASACASSSDGPVERVAQQGSALTSASADILGFEVASSWTASQGTAALSNTHTQGLHSLSVAPRGYVTYTSARLSSLSGVSSKIAFDLQMPSAQANPSWFGAAQLYLSIPSRSVYNAYLGQVELTGLPLQNWNSLVYTIPDDLVAKLKTTYTDATFSIALNVPTNAKGSYLLDNMRDHLSQGDATFDFCVQFQTDPKKMPIEDAMEEWEEKDSPYRKVATIRIPSQAFESFDQMAFAEKIAFNPWNALEPHQPLGGMNRARRAIYIELSKLRHAERVR